MGVISEETYNDITGKIPRRYSPSNTQPSQAQLTQPVAPDVRPVPAPMGLGMAEAIYEYVSTDPHDLPFKRGDTIILLELINADWWRGRIGTREGIFPSSYVKRIGEVSIAALPPADEKNYSSYAPVMYSAPAQVGVVQDKKNGKLHQIGGKLGNAAIFGAG